MFIAIRDGIVVASNESIPELKHEVLNLIADNEAQAGRFYVYQKIGVDFDVTVRPVVTEVKAA